jgi:LPS export ABC transporter protein LptC
VFRAAYKKPGVKPGAEPATQDLRMTTSYLRVLPDADHADTPARVVIENGPSTLIGTGMDFDNRYRKAWLHSTVTAHYVVSPQK